MLALQPKTTSCRQSCTAAHTSFRRSAQPVPSTYLRNQLPFTSRLPRRRLQPVSATDNGDGKESKEAEKLVKGLDKQTAQKVLKAWEASGASSADELRKLLVKRSVQSAGAVLIQTLLDAGASWGGFTTAGYLSQGGDFFGKVIVQYLAYFLGLYFGIGVVLDLFLLGATAFAGINYSTNAEAFLKAVKQVAGDAPKGLSVIEKAQSAVNTVKIITALNEISDILKTKASGEGASSDTLKNLSAFLLLQRAEQKGFDPKKYGLSQDKAADYAAVFSKYDINDDFSLEPNEICQLFNQEGYSFDDAECKAAVKILDKNNDGLISFEEFVEWSQSKLDPAKAPEPMKIS